MSLAFCSHFIRNQRKKLPVPTHSFVGQTVIVIGSNTGLGYEAAKRLVNLGVAKVILAVRTTSKGEKAKQRIEQETQQKNSVKNFAERATSLERLDVVIENAGIASMQWSTNEGYESTIQVNVTATILLGMLLLPTLERTAEVFKTSPRPVIVASDLHHVAKFNERKSARIFETLNDKAASDMNDRYNVSKLLEVYAVRELAAELSAIKPDVTVNVMNPGLCESELIRDLKGMTWVAVKVMRFFLARTTEQGVRTLVHAASCGIESHGRFLESCEINE